KRQCIIGCGKAGRYCARRQFSLLKQLRLVFANVPRAQAFQRTVESSREIFNWADVTTYGILRIIATLEILQRHFSQMGHRDLLVTQNLSQLHALLLRSSRGASAARRLRSNALSVELTALSALGPMYNVD